VNWVLWLLISNAGIFWLEYAYRTSRYESFMVALPYIIFPILIGQVGLFYAFRTAPSLFVCGVVFTIVNVGLRLINSYYIGEHLNVWNWFGIVLLVCSLILLKIK